MDISYETVLSESQKAQIEIAFDLIFEEMEQINKGVDEYENKNDLLLR